MSDASQPTSPAAWPIVVAVIGVFAIFLIIMQLAKAPIAPLTAVDNVPEDQQWKLTDEGRQARLKEIKGRDAALAAEYAWIDEANGVVRLPVDRAIELTLAEINADR